METIFKTNGFTLDKKTQEGVNKWISTAKKFFGDDIKLINLFYYGNDIVFADVYLNNKSYGEYNIHKHTIHFNGHRCTREEYQLFSDLTHGDELNGNKIVF